MQAKQNVSPVSILMHLRPGPAPTSWSIHGRHLSITPEIEAAVKSRLAATLQKLQRADVLESEGGVAAVDVRLMNSQVCVRLFGGSLLIRFPRTTTQGKPFRNEGR